MTDSKQGCVFLLVKLKRPHKSLLSRSHLSPDSAVFCTLVVMLLFGALLSLLVSFRQTGKQTSHHSRYRLQEQQQLIHMSVKSATLLIMLIMHGSFLPVINTRDMMKKIPLLKVVMYNLSDYSAQSRFLYHTRMYTCSIPQLISTQQCYKLFLVTYFIGIPFERGLKNIWNKMKSGA